MCSLSLKYLFIYVAALGFSRIMQHGGAPGSRAHSSEVAGHGLRCLVARGILVMGPGIKPASPASQGGVLTSGLPGKSLFLSLLGFLA